MSRPAYRPTLESLERREVFSAGSLMAMPVEAVAVNENVAPPTEAVVVTDTLPAGVMNNGPDDALNQLEPTKNLSWDFRKDNEIDSQVATGDTNGDGLADIITSASNKQALLLPYIEQDNVYRYADTYTSSDPLPPGLALAKANLTEGGGLWNDRFAVTNNEGGGGIFNNGGTLNIAERPPADLNDVYASHQATHDAVFEQWGNLEQHSRGQTSNKIIAVLVG